MHYRGSFFFFFWLSSLISVHKVPVENCDMLMSLEAALGVLCLCAVAGSASLTALGGKEAFRFLSVCRICVKPTVGEVGLLICYLGNTE